MEKFLFLDQKIQPYHIGRLILSKEVSLKNVPLVKDIFTMVELLNFIGIKTRILKKKFN